MLTKKNNKFSNWLSSDHSRRLLLVMSIALVVYGTVGLIMPKARTIGTGELPNSSVVINEDISNPSEQTVDYNSYKVSPNQPRLIKIPTINVVGPIQRVGLNKDNAVTVPTNINFAGWYTNSQKPGDQGLSLIDGHVSGRYKDGIFKKLKDIKPDDIIQIEYGDGSIRQFSVVDKVVLNSEETAKIMLDKRPDIESQLNLITCEGPFDRSTQQYQNRLLVVTRMINE